MTNNIDCHTVPKNASGQTAVVLSLVSLLLEVYEYAVGTLNIKNFTATLFKSYKL